ncbi:uncharacterized protein BDR25DRAFT_326858 [Lindgomyces ingoldianus]|uniref:Uncharacterized protein n=1 Tax=Lindgomyces ingoldianus TaxID=673940 RepID=A0ACB6QM68_9PLEO|nr:uncharacterized protein BDR25DRAFT_326858 [Lindgomyces ingoldianus]KAF2468069.1 hypothetical protein BDR25DRAFT_326858 [Lindgomyces ingoldianus]
MFKPQILRRSFSVFNKIPKAHIIRSAARDGHERVHIQRVRFKKPFLTRSRFISTAIATATIYGALRWLDDVGFEDEDDDEVEEDEEDRKLRQARRRAESEKRGQAAEADREDFEEGDDEDEEDDEDEDDDAQPLIFFPTGFTRAKPRTYYRGSDPEWQEFIRMAQDRSRMQRIQLELVGIIRDLGSKRRDYIHRLGRIDTQAGTWWIEIKFPDGPPIEFERPGIEISDHLTYRWTTRPVDEFHHQRLNNLLFPKSVANSIYADSKKKAESSWIEFKNLIGWGNKKTETKQTTKPQLLTHPPTTPNNPEPQHAGQKSTPSPPPDSPSDSPSPPSPASETRPESSSQPPSQKEPTASSTLDNPAYERFGLALPSPKTLTLDLSTFRQALQREWQPYKIQPPRGTFIVHGLVELMGERAKMTLDVTATYDPSMGKFTMFTGRIRSITDYRQDPKGGP